MFKLWLNRKDVVDLIGADNHTDWSRKSIVYELKTILYFALEGWNFAAVESLDRERNYLASDHALLLRRSELKKYLIVVCKII